MPQMQNLSFDRFQADFTVSGAADYTNYAFRPVRLDGGVATFSYNKSAGISYVDTIQMVASSVLPSRTSVMQKVKISLTINEPAYAPNPVSGDPDIVPGKVDYSSKVTLDFLIPQKASANNRAALIDALISLLHEGDFVSSMVEGGESIY